MTLEEAQARIIELTEELAQERISRDALSQENDTLKADCETLRTLNQKYFNKLIAQEGDIKKDEGAGKEDEIVPTCEEFAETLNI